MSPKDPRDASRDLYRRSKPHRPAETRPDAPATRPAETAPTVITSLTNPVVKDLRALHMKKEREESGLFLAEGLKLVTDALEVGWPIRTLVHATRVKIGRAHV